MILYLIQLQNLFNKIADYLVGWITKTGANTDVKSRIDKLSNNLLLTKARKQTTLITQALSLPGVLANKGDELL